MGALSTTEQRRAFNAAIAAYRAKRNTEARDMFRAITESDPSMADAWLGRLVCGDHDVDTLAGAHQHSRTLYRETRRIGLRDGELSVQIPAPLYITVPVWSRPTIALAYAGALIDAERYPAAAALLDDPIIGDDAQAAHWQQFIQVCLYRKTERWPDLCSAAAISPPSHATYALDVITEAVRALAAAAAASLGQAKTALEMLDGFTSTNPYIAADSALTRGLCLRETGEHDAAWAAFQHATVDGQMLEAAQDAIDNPDHRLVVTDAETIATRTDKWNPATQTSHAQRSAQTVASEREAALARAQERADKLIGLAGPKEQMRVWQTELLLDQLSGSATNNENNMMLIGPPGVAKTTFARMVADILFGLGKIGRPEVIEVTEEDIVVGYVSQTPARMKEICESALDAVLFLDEAYRLVPEHKGHSFGKDAINTLMRYMEDYRDRLVVIVAGYQEEMRRFRRANKGLAGRFHFTLTFDSYTPDEIVAIGKYFAADEYKLEIADDAWPVLHDFAATLLGTPGDGDGSALDAAGNGRYARKVIRACRSERARRMCDMPPTQVAALAKADPSVLIVNPEDMKRAVTAALAADDETL